jgi:hypothetical protein
MMQKDYLRVGSPLLLLALLTGCAALSLDALNEDIPADLSEDPKTCINGIQYLPYTNGTVQAYTSEGKSITCTPEPTEKK